MAVETRAAGLIVAAALLGVGFATFGNVYIENDFTHVLSEIAIPVPYPRTEAFGTSAEYASLCRLASAQLSEAMAKQGAAA